MQSISNIFPLLTTFQHDQCVHSFPMDKDNGTCTVQELQVVKTPLATLQNTDGS